MPWADSADVLEINVLIFNRTCTPKPHPLPSLLLYADDILISDFNIYRQQDSFKVFSSKLWAFWTQFLGFARFLIVICVHFGTQTLG